jgi:excinuclease ABC subunit C
MNDPAPAFDPKAFLSQLTSLPGVYRMYDAGDELLYVGKARNLKKRVGSYFLRASGNPRTESMVAQINRMEVTLTSTEDAALLLEAALIKELRPRYNVMFRDDKSYPMLRVSSRHAFPRISFYRGGKEGADHYYGPFPSAGSVREMLQTLQKLFRLRPCTDAFFANRKRPCLQYQIRRCSGPCVGLIEPADYARDVARAERLLDGRSDELVRELGEEMEHAAEALDFEHAARVRDQIASFRSDRDRRAMTGDAQNADVFTVAPHGSFSCVVVVSVRDGVNLGHGSFFPRHPPETEIPELLASFIAQYYVDRPVPADILVGCLPEDVDWLQHSLGEKAGRKVRISKPARGARLRLLAMADNTAKQSLSTRLIESSSMDQRLEELQEALALEKLPQRLECFDISHTRGERAVASCVVFNEEGLPQVQYRRHHARRRLRRHPPGGVAPLHPRQGRRSAAAGRAVYRRRQGSARCRAGSIRCNRFHRNAGDRHRQGPDPQAGA